MSIAVEVEDDWVARRRFLRVRETIRFDGNARVDRGPEAEAIRKANVVRRPVAGRHVEEVVEAVRVDVEELHVGLRVGEAVEVDVGDVVARRVGLVGAPAGVRGRVAGTTAAQERREVAAVVPGSGPGRGFSDAREQAAARIAGRVVEREAALKVELETVRRAHLQAHQAVRIAEGGPHDVLLFHVGPRLVVDERHGSLGGVARRPGVVDDLGEQIAAAARRIRDRHEIPGPVLDARERPGEGSGGRRSGGRVGFDHHVRIDGAAVGEDAAVLGADDEVVLRAYVGGKLVLDDQSRRKWRLQVFVCSTRPRGSRRRGRRRLRRRGERGRTGRHSGVRPCTA